MSAFFEVVLAIGVLILMVRIVAVFSLKSGIISLTISMMALFSRTESV